MSNDRCAKKFSEEDKAELMEMGLKIQGYRLLHPPFLTPSILYSCQALYQSFILVSRMWHIFSCQVQLLQGDVPLHLPEECQGSDLRFLPGIFIGTHFYLKSIWLICINSSNNTCWIEMCLLGDSKYFIPTKISGGCLDDVAINMWKSLAVHCSGSII